jgi:hypothetical protein
MTRGFAEGDFNGDGWVTLADYNIWFANDGTDFSG